MATAETVMQIIIKGTDNASSVVRQVGDNVNKTAQEVEQAGDRMKKSLNMDSIMQSVNKVSNTLLGLGAAGMGVAGVIGKLGLDLNKSIAATGSIAGATKEQLKELEALARDVGRTTMVSASNAADAMYYLASAGFNTSQVMTSLRGVTQLAEATFSDVALASQIVVNTLSQFSLAAEDSSRVADVMVKTITSTQATIEKLANSLKYAGPVANAFGLSIEETNAALGVFYNAGLSGEQAGTAFRNILLNLATPTETAATLIQQLGLSLDEVDPSKHNLIEIAEAFKRAGASASDLSVIVGKEAVAAMLALMTNSGMLDELTNKLKNAAGAAEQVAEQMRASDYGQFQLAINQLKELAYSAFPAVAQAIRTLAEPLLNLVNWFNNLDERTQSLITKFLVYGSATALVLGGIGKLITMFYDLSKAIGTLMASDFAKHIAGWTLKALEFIKVDMIGTLTKWGQAFATWAATAQGQIALVSGAVGLLIYDIMKAIQLMQTLKELSDIKKDIARIQKETGISETFNTMFKEIQAISTKAADELSKAAKTLVEKGYAKTVQEAGLIALTIAKGGELGKLVEQYGAFRVSAEKAVKEFEVKVKLDTSDFDTTWAKAGQTVKDRIAKEILEGRKY